jgi:hypothetical protein
MVEAVNLKNDKDQVEDIGLRLVKLVTGEELLGYVTNDFRDAGPKIRNPIQVVIAPPNTANGTATIGMLDWLPTMEGDSVVLYVTSIVAIAVPQETLRKYWNEKFPDTSKPKFIMPVKPKLVT